MNDTAAPVDPDALIAEVVEAATRPERRRDVILGALMLVAGFAFALLGLLVLAGAFTGAMVLGFGGLGLGVAVVFAGASKLTRGLRAA